MTGVDEADEVEALLADTAAGLLGHVAPAGRELQTGGVHVTARHTLEWVLEENNNNLRSLLFYKIKIFQANFDLIHDEYKVSFKSD